MNRTSWILMLALGFVLILTSCAPAANATPIPPVILDSSTSTTSDNVKASAEVIPAREAFLSFPISGLVKEVLVEEGDVVEAGQPLLSLDMSEQALAISAAESAVISSEINAQLQRIRNKKFVNGKIKYTSGPREQIIVADSKVEQNRAAVETAKAFFAQGTIYAPFEGTVVEIDISPGEYVQPSQVVLLLATLQDLQVETIDLSELDIADVEIGQPAIVFVEALDKEYSGSVTTISPIFDTVGGDVVFDVTIQLDENVPDLLWGMSADVEIDVE